MLASNDNSYAKEYARRRQARGGRRPGPGGAAGEMLLTDRGEYIKFLESQLDAVTQACLTASFDERIVAAGAAAASHDEKILNLARLIKCAQGVAEEQERAYHAAMERACTSACAGAKPPSRASPTPKTKTSFARRRRCDAKDWRTARLAIRTSSRTYRRVSMSSIRRRVMTVTT